ncbi:tyrosine-protein kinase JAK2, partial [Tachysurus ichikawai]
GVSVGQVGVSVGEVGVSVGQVGVSVGQVGVSVGQVGVSLGQVGVSVGQSSRCKAVYLCAELSNLIIIRNSSVCETPSSPTQNRHRPSHIQFHMIKHEDLIWKESLGQGSFTHIYRGCKVDHRDGETHTTDVLLKVLDVEHKNSWESFFEAVSFMSQISHKHLLLVYGVSVHKSKSYQIEEEHSHMYVGQT